MNFQPHIKNAAVAVAILAAGSPAYSDDRIQELETIRVIGSHAQTVLGNDQISTKEIEQRNPNTIRDVFNGESSITTSGGAAIATKVLVNGIEESLLSVTIDGARQNKSAFHHTGNVLIDPDLLKRVKVTKGLAPADAGPGGLGGSIAYETKDASDLLQDNQVIGGKISLNAGNNQSAHREVLSVYGQSDNVGGVFSAAQTNSDDYENADGQVVDGTQQELSNYIAKLHTKTESGHKFELSASQTKDTGKRTAQGGPGGILFIRPDFAGLASGLNQFAEGLSKRESYVITYTTEEAQGNFDPTFQITLNEQEIDVSGVYGKNESLSGTFKNNFEIADGTIAAGLDFFNETAEGEGRGPGPFGSSGKEEHENIGLFTQIRQDLGDRLSASYGVRFDSQKFIGANDKKFDDTGVSGNGSLDIVLTDAISLNAGYASTWGGYELGEAALINFFFPWSYNGFTTSRADASRIGLRIQQGAINLRVAAFETDIEDLNAILPSGGNRGATVDLESKGYEMAIGYRGNNGFVNLNFTSIDLDVNDQTIDTRAYYLGRPVGEIIALEAGYKINSQLAIGATSEMALKNKLDNGTTLDSYEVFNAYLGYMPQHVKNLSVRIDIKNLFDEQYSSRSTDGLGAAGIIPITEPGQNFSLTAAYKF